MAITQKQALRNRAREKAHADARYRLAYDSRFNKGDVPLLRVAEELTADDFNGFSFRNLLCEIRKAATELHRPIVKRDGEEVIVQTREAKLEAALRVFVLDSKIGEFLRKNDPKALEQALNALND